MRRHTNIVSILFTVIFFSFGSIVLGQYQGILDLTVKELDGDTLKFRDKLDPSSNYIIETMAFWCSPCIRSIDKFNYQKNYWKDRFNTNILLIEDEHWNDIAYVQSEMEEYDWDLEIVLSNDQFSEVGIFSIPKYFFKGVASDTLERVYGNIEKFLLERLDSIAYSPILDVDFKQVTMVNDCDQPKIHKLDASNEVVVDNQTYTYFNNRLFREDAQNGNVIYLNSESGSEITHIKYSAPLCSRFWLKDFEGDSLSIKILDRYQQDSVLHVVTDQMLSNSCFEEDIPFEFVQNIGTNAGFDFDIEDGRIVSRLICHEDEETFAYMDNELGELCLSLSTKSLRIEDLDIQVFPNPTGRDFEVYLNFEGEKLIDLFTAKGEKIQSFSTNENVVEIRLPQSIQSSLFLVRVSTSYGVITKRIVKVLD